MLWMSRQCPCWSWYGPLMSASWRWTWSVPAKFLQLGDLHHPKLWSRPFLVQQPGIAGACDMLKTKQNKNSKTNKQTNQKTCQYVTYFYRLFSTSYSNSILCYVRVVVYRFYSLLHWQLDYEQPSSRPVGQQYLLFISFPIHGTLLLQPEQSHMWASVCLFQILELHSLSPVTSSCFSTDWNTSPDISGHVTSFFSWILITLCLLLK